MSALRARHAIAPVWRLGNRAVSALRPAVPGGFRIVLVHDVAEAQLAAFECLVDRVVAVHGAIAPEDAEARLSGRVTDAAPRHRAPCLFSFDDGFQSNERAAEILAARGIRAQFFVCPGLVELEGDAQRRAVAANVFRGRVTGAAMAPHLRLMGWDAIARLRAMGHAIGVHGMTHARLSALDADALEAEIGDARSRIERALGGAFDWFAFAFGTIGSIDARALAVVARHFRYCRSGVRGLNSAATGALAVRADSVDLAAPRAWRDLVLEGGLDARYRGAGRALDGLAHEIGVRPRDAR